MQIIKYFSVFAALSAVVACSAAQDDNTSQSDEDLKAGVYSCKVDSDCVAISKGGCCPNGWNVAVNKHKVKDYESSHECKDPKVCPLYVIDDTRVAECDTAKQKCEMVAPEDIACGGFTANPHKCAKGWKCEANKIPDVPGTCVEK